ncbi:hypothetical protein [Sphingobacterium siyangense]|uniref:hypothetical protein n=1 Tax=Sphingobacterium siyangense TaxID=459529 RepID=UPI003018610C
MKKRKYCCPTIEVTKVQLDCSIAAGSVATGTNMSIENESVDQNTQEWIIDID